MNFQGLGKVETHQAYLDMAFRNGVATAQQLRESITTRDKLNKSKRIEHGRLDAVANSLINNLEGIVKRFPSMDHLAPFYLELIKCTVDYDMMKKSLGAVSWAKRQIKSLYEHHKRLLRTAKLEQLNKTRQAFSGRASSVMKQIKENLEYLEQCRKTMKRFPSIKTGRKTIVIAGAPNVGKSTLLAALTGSKPETAPYPFTTKQINMGYDTEGNQYIDTPGLLDRPLQKRNQIEKQAILALKYLATAIVFVIDPTETCGYKLPQQKSLLYEIKKTFPQPIIIVSNKADTKERYENAIPVSAIQGTGIEELRKKISEIIQKIEQEQPQE